MTDVSAPTMVKRTVTIDEMLVLVGEYGTFQKIVNLALCMNMFPAVMSLFIMYFCTDSPPWRCNINSSKCVLHNETFDSKDRFRCSIPRTEWYYVTSRDHSIVTEFDLICDKEFLTVFPTSALFVGFIFGAVVLGWFADNFGRKKLHYISLAIIILLGFVSTFVGDIYAFILCRFLIGFFLYGTFPQIYVMTSEIVGTSARAWANNLIFISISLTLLFLALKAYLISNWKPLFRVCTMPYIVLLPFYFFVPESVRFSHVKGRMSEAMLVFQRMAHWNKKILLPHITLLPPSKISLHKSNPLHLFRTKKLALITSVISWSAFTESATFYSLSLGAGAITGHKYTDFVVITVIDIPMLMVGNYMLNRLGRKRNTVLFILIGSASCIALGFTPKHGKMTIVRLVFGMFGKTCIMVSSLARNVWSIELFPTHLRGEGLGMDQILNKIGATSSAWIVTEVSKFHDGAAFILIGVLSFSTFCLLLLLPDTNGIDIADAGEKLSDKTNSENVESRGDANERQPTAYTNDVMYLDDLNQSKDENHAT